MSSPKSHRKRTRAQVLASYDRLGDLPTTVLATKEPLARRPGALTVRVAKSLVGGLPSVAKRVERVSMKLQKHRGR